MATEIDTQFTKNIICPYCGHVFTNSWEYNENSKVGCACGRTFALQVDTVIAYSTRRLDDGK